MLAGLLRCAVGGRDAPDRLGPEAPPEWLPEPAARGMCAVETMIEHMSESGDVDSEGDTVRGLAASAGSYEGLVRRVSGPGDFEKVQEDDVLDTESTSPAFNVVLPLLGGVVTDHGGVLSHAAIVAREYGIPGVVGPLGRGHGVPRADGHRGPAPNGSSRPDHARRLPAPATGHHDRPLFHRPKSQKSPAIRRSPRHSSSVSSSVLARSRGPGTRRRRCTACRSGAESLTYLFIVIETQVVENPVISKTVTVLGGGVAGLTAAHELVERGFDVEVYEKRSIFGGKARSVDVPGSANEGNKPLPGEHGFRFFPAFYRHIFDTMRRIPYADNDEGVFDNLVTTTEWMIARRGDSEMPVPIELPEVIENWETVLELLIGNPFGIPDEERQFFIDRLLTFLTACEERRTQEYDNLSWWEFIDAEGKSEAYQQFFGIGVTRSLVAMRAEESSTRSVGRIYVQQLLGMAMPWLHVDSILNGPTNDVWIDPWVEYLDQQGVRFFPETTVESITCIDGRIAEVEVAADGSNSAVGGGFYVAALPVEVMSELVTDELAEAAPSLAEIDELETAWMNGIQFYLDEDVSIAHSHVIYQGAPWALTSISQQQFWETDLSEYGNGEVDGILSICISDWTTEGNTVEKPAKECTPEEIKREVWSQLIDWLNDDETEELKEANVITWFLDPDIEFPAPNETTNAEPLLINTVGSLRYRPEATTAVPNLFLASDYVRTNTDLATMEAANEAARRAVNGLLDAAGSNSDRCEVWPLEEPAVFEPMKAYDRLRFKMGLPHQGM